MLGQRWLERRRETDLAISRALSHYHSLTLLSLYLSLYDHSRHGSTDHGSRRTEEEHGYRYVPLTEEALPGLASLRSEVCKAIEAGRAVKSAKDMGAEAKTAYLADAAASAHAERNVLFEYCSGVGVQAHIFKAIERADDPGCFPPGKETVEFIWSTQLRSVPADLIARPKPNVCTDGAAKDPHVDSHPRRVLTEYVVDAARLDDCWTHSGDFRALVGRWMSRYFPADVGDKAKSLGHLTQDMRRLRYQRTYVDVDARVAPLLREEVSDLDKEPSTFWGAFDLVPLRAWSFWCNLTPEADQRVAKPLGFAAGQDVVEVAERSLTKKPMPPRPGAESVLWASHTLSGPEYSVKPGAEYSCVPEQPFGFVAAFDTCVSPHVAHIGDDRADAIRVSLEGRKLRFAVDSSAWGTTQTPSTPAGKQQHSSCSLQ